ncbi:MAG: CDP-glycerol glycerophosphotransferase family protein [Clostridia bacterium]|nr:CDP-glycerol glycerophosphotransferase family protein [Clostridia bacterium]
MEKDIWLIREKPNEARDNGYHFFKYMRNNHPQIQTFFVISKNAPDYSKVESFGNIIETNSFQHVLLYLACRYSISSQAYGAYPFKMDMKQIKMSSRFCNKNQKVIFLQHGITKDSLSHSAFDEDKCNIDYFVTSTEQEYQFIKERHGYNEKNIGCTGLCRFDNLFKAKGTEENIILIMPTWRTWLGSSDPNMVVTEAEKQQFASSDFYNRYVKLLTDPTLKEILGKYDFKIVFYLHYQIQKYTELFVPLCDERVIIAGKKAYDVQDLLMKSKIMITDYSSVFFDFAYMKKPLIYYQFDENRFFSNHYQKGYFSYYDDGFGVVCHGHNEVVSELQGIFENGCQLTDKYLKRIEGCFKYTDAGNCQRTYEAILKL